jgi:hypothetical protein
MSTLRQIEANRRNALLSTGPVTDDGKRRSRQNAVRHGLTAETVITTLEDADDYEAFEMSVTADYDPQSAVERELILRLASLLWRLRRATAIETGLFEIRAPELLKFRHPRPARDKRQDVIDDMCRQAILHDEKSLLSQDTADASAGLTQSFLRLNALETCPLDRLSRYEAALWRQAGQILFTLHSLNRRSTRRTRFR